MPRVDEFDRAGLKIPNRRLGIVLEDPPVGAGFDLGASRIEGVLAYPLGAALTASILAEATADLEQKRAVEWGGKKYVRPVDRNA